jgi:putative aminopeptidase FrvX
MPEEEHALAVLTAISGIPTAPFFEHGVARHLAAALQGFGFLVRQDRFGNLLARRRRGRGARPLALVAHMDHPGFVVTRSAEREVMADVLGGLAPSVLEPGTPVRFYAGATVRPGEIQEYVPAAGPVRAAVRAEVSGPLAGEAFGTLDIPSCTRVNGTLALRSADDLAQCACLLLLAERLATVAGPSDVLFVLTRAEEIGLVGATLVAQGGLVPRDAIVVSLECSKAIPGAEIGKGPVIRVGDAGQAFDPRGEALLLAARNHLAPQRAGGAGLPEPAIQRQLMSGGRCEASAFLAHGYVATGVALPLGNYHNAGPDGRAAPEYIHLDDLLGAVDLLAAAVGESSRPLPDRVSRLTELAGEASARLVSSAGEWQLGLPPAVAEPE